MAVKRILEILLPVMVSWRLTRENIDRIMAGQIIMFLA
jgi:hypothetical protein